MPRPIVPTRPAGSATGSARRFVLASTIAAALAVPVPAAATLGDVSATGFVVTLRRETPLPADRVFDALTQVDRWWSDRHTWSGSASHLSLQADAGGCFCERWDGHSVEHGRVVYVARGSTLRLVAALGPLQALPVQAVLTFSMAERDGRTVVQVTYRVGGTAAELQPLASAVDGVLTEQVDRLMRYAESGKPDPAP